MSIVLKKVESASETRHFIRFPHQIYSPASPWVAPLDSERKAFLNPETNPFFDHADVEYYLALAGSGETLGRIAAVVDRDHNQFHKEKTGFFGMFECVNDPQPAALLLDAAERWCRDRGMDRMRGPMNLSINHECGLLVDNFDDPPVLGIPYNPPYYVDLFHQWGLKKIKDLISFHIHLTDIPEYLQRAVPLIQKRNCFTIRNFKVEQFEKEIDVLWEIYNSAWETNWGFVPMNRKEFTFTAREMKTVMDSRLCYIAEVGGEPAGFALTLPDFNQVLKNMRGKLFPFGWLKFILGKSRINRHRVITLGVKKQYQRLGIDAVFYFKIYKQLLEMKKPCVETSWVLEDNQAMIGPIERIGAVLYKRHRLYERNFTH